MIYISIIGKDGLRSVVEANEKQTKALEDFLNKEGDGDGDYNISHYYSTKNIIIEDLYEIKLNNGTMTLISKNYEKLNNYIGFINRLTTGI
jgi:hypothetical protein